MDSEFLQFPNVALILWYILYVPTRKCSNIGMGCIKSYLCYFEHTNLRHTLQ